MARQQDTGVAEAAGRRYWRVQDVRIVIDSWRRSGLTMSALAKKHAVHMKRLSRWAQRLELTSSSVKFHPLQLLGHECTGERRMRESRSC